MQVSLEIQNRQVSKIGDHRGWVLTIFIMGSIVIFFHRQQVKEMADATRTSMRFLSSIVRIPLWWVTIYIHSCFI